MQATLCLDICGVQRALTDCDWQKRVKSFDTMTEILNRLEYEAPSKIFNLLVSKGTKLSREAAKLIAGGHPSLQHEEYLSVPNDGTKACAFLALKICSALLKDMITYSKKSDGYLIVFGKNNNC